MNAVVAFKNAAWRAYHVLIGGGAKQLTHKREYHVRRDAAERAALAKASRENGMLAPNLCPACGSPSTGATRLRNPLGCDYAICPADGTVYMDPVWSPDALVALNNHEAESFGWKVQEKAVGPGCGEDYSALVRMLPRVVGRPRLLDIGCATGAFLLTAQQKFETEGLELNDATASVARNAGLHVRTGTVRDLPETRCYGVVTMLQVVEHLVEPSDSLAAIGRLLDSDGHLYLSTPSVESCSFDYLRARHNHVASSRHVSLFTRQGLERLAERTGFEVVAHEYWGGRDLDLHDAVSLTLRPGRFRHRRALYSERLYHASNLVDGLTGGALSGLIFPNGKPSYQRVLLRKRRDE